ncbi:protein MFI isoform X4 [Epinephelus fuscoguttatus]|uniref:protein MFI isoform X4 n=1 Tax=Epinephelus fuscoguttatus TaxID=293821 RepID=UPI0020D09A34|nr:protein MFI isoform X4 [Epinephelus fuscoguttatus]XP_049421902.1 protein MFI isoform X4 [Epinephelus fuscoguttatus]
MCTGRSSSISKSLSAVATRGIHTQSSKLSILERQSYWMLLLACSSDFDLEGLPFLPTSIIRSSPIDPSWTCVPAAQRTTPSLALRGLWLGRPTTAGLLCRRTDQDGTSAWRTTAGGSSVARLQRQQDVDKWRKKRKIEWLKHMYNQGRVQTHPVHGHMATLVGNSAQEVMDITENMGEDEILEWELDELLAWTNTLSFEEYMREWRGLACSCSSEPSKDVPSCPPQVRST